MQNFENVGIVERERDLQFSKINKGGNTFISDGIKEQYTIKSSRLFFLREKNK